MLCYKVSLMIFCARVASCKFRELILIVISEFSFGVNIEWVLTFCKATLKKDN